MLGLSYLKAADSLSPDFCFIRMFIMIYLFVLDDSLTS